MFRDDGFTPLLDSVDGNTWRLVACDQASTPWLYLAADGSTSELDLSPWGDDVRAEGDVGALRFAGQRADEDTGLYYQRHRHYSPELGLFITPDPIGLQGSVMHDVGFVPNVTEFIDPLGLIIILGADDDMSRRAAEARQEATGQRIVRAADLQPDSLSRSATVEIVGHGPPGGGLVTFRDGRGRNWRDGATLGNDLVGYGLQPGAQVVVIACNSSMEPSTSGRDARQHGGESVVAGINRTTGNQTTGPSGVCYVRPYSQQYCGQPGCTPTTGTRGTVDTTDGEWRTATGPAGGERGNNPQQNVANDAPPQRRPGTWTDPEAENARGAHGFPNDDPAQDTHIPP